MAHIKAIRFESVGRKEGCTCDRCGQYIQNIWTVEYQEGLTIHYGIDCWQKVKASGNLSAYGKKLLNKIIKSVQAYSERLAQYTSGELTEENDQSWLNEVASWERCDGKNSCWNGKSYAEYRKWMVEEFFPYRISAAQKELDKFKKVNFEA